MRACNDCPYYPDYDLFRTYYGDFDYADKWVMSASFGNRTAYSSGRGNADFSKFAYKDGAAEAMELGALVLNIWMYVVRQLEDAIDDCEKGCTLEQCNSDPVHGIDEAVAFYAGSSEGTDGWGTGYLLYDLADNMAVSFRTAGLAGDSELGTSYVNTEVVREFKKAQLFLLSNDCESAKANKQRIINLMKIPLVQGALQFAHIRSHRNPDIEAKKEEAEAEGATFAAAILPYVHNCSALDADIIHSNLKVGSAGGSDNLDYTAVKEAFERNYECMGISCREVGGLWGVSDYLPGAAPCGDVATLTNSGVNGATGQGVNNADTGSGSGGSSHRGHGFGVVFALGLVFGSVVLGFAYMRKMRNNRRPQLRTMNIAAVSNIS